MLAGRNITRATIAGALLAAALGTGAPASAAAVGITIDGNPVTVNPGPIVRYGRVLVPLRGVFESLNASVVYDSGVITAQGQGHGVTLHIGSTQALIDGQPQTLDVAPFIVGASTYVPLRFVSTALGAQVDYDDSARIVAITSSGYVAQQPAQQATPPSYAYDDGYASSQNYENYVTEAPPAIPDYEQPPVPAPDEIWQPGYWGWGPGGYFWVPGTWVQPPQPNLYWTPPYWSFINNVYAFNPGYWAQSVGYYGGVNYGSGYYGNGYDGGRWQNGNFYYNTYVTHVTNVTVVKNVYVDRTVIVNRSTTEQPSYNGGPHGTTARPPARGTVARSGRVPMTQAQIEHQQEAERDRRFLSSVNAGKPPVLAAPQPLSQQATPQGFVPLTETDKNAGAHLIAHPVTRPVRDDGAAPTPRPATPKPVPPDVRPFPVRGDVPSYARPTPTPKPTLRPEFATPLPAERTAPPPPRTPAPPPRTAPPPIRTPMPPPPRTPEPQQRTPQPPPQTAPAAATPPPGMPTPRPHPPRPKRTPRPTPEPT